ncbi:hypothetical protein [Stutzerimonas stutzeri]|uniref:hypothetical protein n=1 Tax=Stutzerimonas stutzeri TaxID=316 RepID=UPI0015E324B7|nr:hypothetical protein [Stutzerimonas stutzeri]MBA1280326.1 hypothetical protein [Stutzerimonas stutzeri]
MRKVVAALTVALSLAGCANMDDMRSSFDELTTSSLVGTWVAEFQCQHLPYRHHAIITFKQSKVPLVAEGQYYGMKTYPDSGTRHYSTIQVDGEMSLTGVGHIREKAWIVKPAGTWHLEPWEGKRISAGKLDMRMGDDCKAPAILTKVNDDFITELRPEAVYRQYQSYFKTR